MQLRAELKLDLPAATTPPVFGSSLTNTNSPVPEMSATTGDLDATLERLGLRSDRFYLSEGIEPEPDNVLVRGYNAVFEPEIVQLGKTTVSCSIITAVKRKNPLCLLNPLFFNLSW